MDSERAALTPSPPWGRGGALHRQWANDLCVELSLHDQFQTYTQFIRTYKMAASGSSVLVQPHPNFKDYQK